MKIPFDIKYRPQIESGEYKVETRNGLPVRIICWDRLAKKHNNDDLNLCVLIPDDGGEDVYYYDRSGKRWVHNDDFDLFIVTPEEELTEFEKGIKRGFLCAGLEDVPMGIIKETAKELLGIAKKELCKVCAANLEGYMKGRQDALKEMKENRVYKHEGPTIPAPVPAPVPVFWPPCHYGGECTNPFHDCINCHRQSTDGISTTTGTSTAKVEG